jgi:uncharacterized protein
MSEVNSFEGVAAATNTQSINVFRNIMVPMRDGVKLSTDIFLPADVPVDAKALPALVTRTPYGKHSPMAAVFFNSPGMAARGYAIVVQDKRGRYASEGEYVLLGDDMNDGYDTIEWVARQPWSNGRVGMYGISYMGHTTLEAAKSAPPHLVAGVPTQPSTDPFTQGAYADGVLLSAQALWSQLTGEDWLSRHADTADHATAMAELLQLTEEDFMTLPLTDRRYLRHLPPFWAEPLSHRDDVEWFPSTSTAQTMDKVAIPMLHVGSWFDPFLVNTTEQFRIAAASPAAVGDNQNLLIGPWRHGMLMMDEIGEVSVPDAAIDYQKLVADWQDRWMKDKDAAPYHRHRVIAYVLGENRWRADSSWPFAGAVETPIYLGPDRTLAFSAAPDCPPDRFDYDPATPHRAPSVVEGAADFSKHLAGDNMLVYTSEPFAEAMEIAGPLRMELHAASSATDTDWMVEVHDVYPDGRSMLLSEGIARARYRHSRSAPQPLEPGKIERYSVSLRPVANMFKPGHALRIVVTSGKFPRFERNPNAYVDLATYTETDMCVAHQSIHMGGHTPSALFGYVVPKDQPRNWIENPAPPGPPAPTLPLDERSGDQLPATP